MVGIYLWGEPQPLGVTTKRALCALAFVSLAACDDDGAGEQSAAIRIEAADGIEGVTRLRIVVKRESANDAGLPSRVVIDRTVEVNDGLEAPFRVPSSLVPGGEGPVYLHAVAYAGEVVAGIGDAALGDGGGVHLVQVRALPEDCDRDGDTFVDCDNLASECCAQIEQNERSALDDCVDARGDVPANPGDTKRRDPGAAHGFAASEDDGDYFTCGNGVDDDCTGGDLPCGDEDGDMDGDPVGTDCDDADPGVGPSTYDVPGDGIDQDCDGVDGEGTDADADGYRADDPDLARRDCDDDDPTVHPGGGDIACNGVDEDCSGADLCAAGETDTDGDGVADDQDCAPFDAGAHAGAAEKCGDGVDQDCDGSDEDCAGDDTDGDGFGADDCDDTDPHSWPGAPERCGDAVDQDCDGADAACTADDTDSDGFLPPADCDVGDRSVHPHALEVCDQRDNDCDGRVDEGNPRIDAEGDEFAVTCGVCQQKQHVCTQGVVRCLPDDAEPVETCNGLDDDCDGAVDNPPDGADRMPDEGTETCGPAVERGACVFGLRYCRNGALDDCRGAVEPSDEACNGLDDDCDGEVDEGEVGGALSELCFDGEEAERNTGACVDGIRECVMSVEGGADFGACGNQVLPAEETCNGFDDDCDGAADELAVACYTFEEGVVEGNDGALVARGECRVGERTCGDGEELGDCEGQVGPTAEVCDGLDNDCDNRVDQFTEACFGEALALDDPRVGVGICRAGSRVCIDSAWQPCVGELLPTDETCDGRDNDCDGVTDEDFDRQNDPRHCGVCNRECGAGQACCSGACRPTDTEVNCGGCGVSCIGRADRCVVLDGAEAPTCRCGEGAPCDEQSGEGQNLVCDDGQCVCEVDTDCADDELCCAGACQPTGPGGDEQCETCGVACDAGRSNGCVDRECVCGSTGLCPQDTICAENNGVFRCAGCRDNRQCPPDAMCCGQVCVPTNAELQCGAANVDCNQACDLRFTDACQGAAGSFDRTCVCGSGDDAGPCRFTEDDDPDSLYCLRGAAPGDGRCVQCRYDLTRPEARGFNDCPVLVDEGGDALPQRDQRPRCVENRCERCDPNDHDPCGPGQLCCGLRCVPTSERGNGPCEACDQACDEPNSSVCAARTCRCGGGPPCAGGTPFCLDDGQPVRCVECRSDVDCGGDLECVNFECKACDPANHDGCGANQLCCIAGGEPTCEGTSAVAGQCEACDVGCNALATNRCTSRDCRCGGGGPCAGDTPVCDDDRGQCVECVVDANCNGHADGNQCVDFECRPCDPADHAGCLANQLCCAAGGSFRCEATQGGAAGQCEACRAACGTRSDVCTDRSCACGDGDACDPQGGEPYCVGGVCEECRANGDCAGDELCCAGTCEATGAGAGEQCEACGAACVQESTNRCTSRDCRCGGGNPCRGNTPVCDDERGRCVQCLDNADCDGANTQCVNFVCEECNAVNHAGCGENSDAPFCDAVDLECRACAGDGECFVRPGVRQECVAGRCARCDPADNSGCQAALPVCDAETFSCRQCALSDECPGDLQCVGGRCEGCDPGNDAPCGGATPICDPDSLQCRACANDGDCAARPGPEDQCLPDGRCSRCDPANHAGCGNNQLCCNLTCQATSANGQCEACGVACDADSTDGCAARQCRCGGAAECGGQTAFCDDPNDRCVNCRADGDCDAAEPECVQSRCEACDPADDAGCAADGGNPVCDAGTKTCRACGADGECNGNGNGDQCVADGECETCDTVDDAGCAPGGRAPICAGNPEGCRGCQNNGECAGNAGNGGICAEAGQNDGACGACDPADDEGCNNNSATPVCDAGDLTCRRCANDGECVGNPRGDECVATGRCRDCDPADDTGCVSNSTAPICAANNFQCRACANDGECGGNASGEQCVTGGADVGACRFCDSADDAGCDAGGNAPVCDGDDYQCRACEADAECAGNPNGPFCIAGACEACKPDSNEGCNAAAADPICRGLPLECQACNNDAQCAANPNGDVCSALGCRVCDPGDHQGCDEDSNSPFCAGVPPACRGCANDGECADNPNGGECVNGACQNCNPANNDGCDAGGNAPVCAGNPPDCRACANSGECAGNANGNVCSDGSCGACDDHPDCVGHPEGNVCEAGACSSCDGDDQQCVGHPVGATCDGDNCTNPG